MSRKVENISVMRGTTGLVISFIMSEVDENGSVIRTGIRKSKAISEADTKLWESILIVRTELELEENVGI